MSEPLFPNQNPKSGTDAELDQMFERALSAREFALAHGWPLPEPFRPNWRRILAVVLGSVLGTLLMGQGLEYLRLASQKVTPSVQPIPTVPQPTNVTHGLH
jgi:hypothetical protein